MGQDRGADRVVARELRRRVSAVRVARHAATAQSPAATRPSVQRSHTAPTRWLGPGRCVACFSRSWSSPRSSPFRRGIAFGPDGALYVATGDAGVPELAQDPNSRNGKFLRIPGSDLRDGGRARPQIVSLGHRNPQGIDFQPGSGRLVATEHGQEACDEVNVIRQGTTTAGPRSSASGRYSGVTSGASAPSSRDPTPSTR